MWRGIGYGGILVYILTIAIAFEVHLPPSNGPFFDKDYLRRFFSAALFGRASNCAEG